MAQSLLELPTNVGWVVHWETGEIIPRTRKVNGVRKQIGVIKVEDSFYTTSRERAEQKAEQLKAKGYNGVKIFDCIF